MLMLETNQGLFIDCVFNSLNADLNVLHIFLLVLLV